MADAPLAIFLSPHFDDIALSCGGIAARLSRTGVHCICLTVFAAPAPSDGPLSPFAQQLHSQWEGDSDAQGQAINDVRREEERQALKILGLEPMWLDLPDAPYRTDFVGRHHYTSDDTLFNARPAPEERHTVVPYIAEEIRRVSSEAGSRGRVRVFAPLGAGGHVDHVLVFLAARRLGPRYGVLFYEDFPYSAKEGALQTRLEQLKLPVRPRLTPIDDLIGVKIAAIARYKSQLGVLFGSAEEMPAIVRGYARAVGATGNLQYAERFWYTPPSYALGG